MAKIKNPFTGTIHKIKIPIYDIFDKAGTISAKAQQDRDAMAQELADKRQEAQDSLELFGRAKFDVLDGSLRTFVQQFTRLKDIELMPALQYRKEEAQEIAEVAELQQVDFKSIGGLKAALIAGGAGAASGAVTFATVGTFASASTGTAIATLHGVAATNATLAFLGGGPLAVGGTGMAGGAAVLGGVVAAPVLILGGVFLNKIANAKLNTAKQDAKDVRKYIEESNKAIAVLVEIKTKSFKLKNILLEFDQRFVPMIDGLKILIDKYTYGNIFKRIYYSLKKITANGLTRIGITPPQWLVNEAKVSLSKLRMDEQEQVMVVVGLAHMIKSILDASLIDDAGLVPASVGETFNVAEQYLSKLT